MDNLTTVTNFLTLLPKHNGMFRLIHNPHLQYYQTASAYLTETIHNDIYDLTNLIRGKTTYDKIAQTNEIWIMEWNPDTPVGICIYIGATLIELLEFIKNIE